MATAGLESYPTLASEFNGIPWDMSMSFFLPCPNCGQRPVHEFRHGGQLPAGPQNLPGLQEERWYHRLGCRHWLLAVRDVRTNSVTETRLLDETKK